MPDGYKSVTWDLDMTQVALMIIGVGTNSKHNNSLLTLTSRNRIGAVYVRGLSFLQLVTSGAYIRNLDIANCSFVSEGTLKTSNQITNLIVTDTVFCNSTIDINDKAEYNWSIPEHNTIRIDRCKFTMDTFAKINWGIIRWAEHIGTRHTPDSFIAITNCFVQVTIPLLWCCPLDSIVIMNSYISACVALLGASHGNVAFANNTMLCNRFLVTKPFSRSNVDNHHCELETSFVKCNLKTSLDILKQIEYDNLANRIRSVAIRYIDSECMTDEDVAADVAIHNRTFDASVPSCQAILKS
ncbi:Hypothetical protein MVR_LOCUS55 [uncultured virus]|nr:Hypothetical protein MVR_LOCUS55 [uncultured virus]